MKIEDLVDYIQYFNYREYSRMWPKMEQLLQRFPNENFGHAWNETDNTILINLGLASKIVCKGVTGFVACTELGAQIYHELMEC